jgi:hypothetical protein
MTRKPHARPYKPTRWDRVKYAVLTLFPLRWWWRLPESTRDWWIRESQLRHGWSPMGRIR